MTRSLIVLLLAAAALRCAAGVLFAPPMLPQGGEGGNAEWSAAMLGNSRGARPLAVLAVLDRAARLLGTRFARLGRFPTGRGHPQGAVMRLSRFSRIAPAKARSSVASARTRSSGASEASGLESLAVTATIGTKTLYSYTDRLTYGTNDTPQVHLSLNIPAAILLNGGRNVC